MNLRVKNQSREKTDNSQEKVLLLRKINLVLKESTDEKIHEEIEKISLLNKKYQQKKLKMRFESLGMVTGAKKA